MHFDFGSDPIYQGSFESGKLRLTENAFQLLQKQKLEGETIAGTIYLHSLEPFYKNEKNNYYESDVVAIFVKVPKEKLIHNVLDQVIDVSLSKAEIIPTKPEKDLIWGNFNIPQKFRPFVWLVLTLTMVLFVAIFLKYRKKWMIKKIKKKKLEMLRQDLLSANSFDEVVTVWKRKHEFIDTFPHLSTPFKELEFTLFKFVFREVQSEEQKKEVIQSYNDFKKKIEGGFSGV